jgi:hypothetical protein
MSLHTLPHVRTNSKAKKSPRLLLNVHVISRHPNTAHKKEACHAL